MLEQVYNYCTRMNNIESAAKRLIKLCLGVQFLRMMRGVSVYESLLSLAASRVMKYSKSEVL